MQSPSTPRLTALALGLLITLPVAPQQAAAQNHLKRPGFQLRQHSSARHIRRAVSRRSHQPVTLRAHQPITLRGDSGRRRLSYEERHWIANGKSQTENARTVDNIRASSACTPPGSTIRVKSQGGGRAKIVGNAGPGGAMGTVKIQFTAREGGIDKRISSKASCLVPFPMRSTVEKTMVRVHHVVAPVERVLGDAEKKARRR